MIPALLAAMAAFPVLATEVYHWVDENGVVHFSQSAPPGNVSGVELMVLDTTQPVPDPEEDLYGVEAQAERMALLRQQMAEKRELERERQRQSAGQAPAPNQQADPYGYPVYGRRPHYPGYRPPVKPRPPVRPEPYPTDTLKRPGRPRD